MEWLHRWIQVYPHVAGFFLKRNFLIPFSMTSTRTHRLQWTNMNLFENIFQSRAFWKRWLGVSLWTDENARFSNRWRRVAAHCTKHMLNMWLRMLTTWSLLKCCVFSMFEWMQIFLKRHENSCAFTKIRLRDRAADEKLHYNYSSLLHFLDSNF